MSYLEEEVQILCCTNFSSLRSSKLRLIPQNFVRLKFEAFFFAI
jgi:hypothetical protein